MRRHKLLSLALALVLALSIPSTAFAVTASTPASPPGRAQSGQDASMETAILAVRAIIDIDDDVYTDFSYSSSYTNQQTREGLVWHFSWSDKQNAYIYVSVTAEGKLLDYNSYDYSMNSFGFAEISRDAAGKTALDFFKKANPDTNSYYSLATEPEITIQSDTYSFNYSAIAGGHFFDAATCWVRVNKFSGEVTSYYTSNLDPRSYTYENAPKLIGTDAAVKAYADKLGLTLEYRSYYDYESGKLSVFPVYIASSQVGKFISAVTGEVVEYVYDRGGENGKLYDGEAPAAYETAADNATGGSRGMTPQETEAVKNVGSFITPDQALAKLLATMELTDLDTSAFSDSHINLNRDYMSRDKYSYRINLYSNDNGAATNGIYSIDGTVDAVTGRVLSFGYYGDTAVPEGAKLMTDAQAEAAVQKFLNANAPDELKKTTLEMVKPPEEGQYAGNKIYYYNYTRVENNTPFKDNSISVMLDAYTGKIRNYSLNWYANATFPSVANVLTPQKALAAYAALNAPETSYITVGGGKASLVYDFGIIGYLDPFTGKALGYDGKAQEANALTPDYSDVKGHSSEKYVTRLLENGIYQWGGKFDPERVMTQREFLEYLMLLEPWYVAEPLQYFRDHGIKTDIKADDKTPVTRQEAARIIAEYMGYGALAVKAKWFSYPFTGAVDEAYKGYITVCCMLGIITQTSGEYNAKAGVTRGEAAMLLHNVILAKTEV